MIPRLARAFAVGAFLALVVLAQRPALAALSVTERSVIVAYLTAIEHGDYAGAFARLSPGDRRYFGSARNLGAVFAADRLALEKFTVLESVKTAKLGTLAVVRERVSFFDHAHGHMASITANVRYGLVPVAGGVAVKDPFHPWYAFAPGDASTSASGIRVSIRKIAFFTGRIEVLATFANTGDATVTLLPYGRSVVRDEAGAAHAPIRSKLPGLTDTNLFEGLRLPPSAQYTGAMTFFTPDRFMPKQLNITFAPALADGSDAPFELKLPPIAVPHAS